MRKLILSAAAVLAFAAPALAESDNLELQARRNAPAIEATLPAGGAAFGLSDAIGADFQDASSHDRPTWTGDR